MRPPRPRTEKCQKKNDNQYCSKHFYSSLPCMQRSCLTCTASPCRDRRSYTALLAKTSNRHIGWAIGSRPSTWINASVAYLLSVGCTFCPPRAVGDPSSPISRYAPNLRALHQPPAWAQGREVGHSRPRGGFMCEQSAICNGFRGYAGVAVCILQTRFAAYHAAKTSAHP
jgi:hypothetical protein